MANTKVKAEQLEAAQTNITSLGTLTALTVDDITIDGSTISDGGDLTLDVAGDIILDAAGSDVRIHNAGTLHGRISNDSNGLWFISDISDKDIYIRGNDGGSMVTALTFDMSDAGAAAFNSFITTTGVYGKGDTNSGIQFDGSDVVTLHTAGAERMRISSGGQVGIGTTSPSYTFTVEKAVTNDWLSRIYNTGTAEGDLGVLIRTGSEHDGTSILSLYSGSSYKFKFQADGNLGIGVTSPTAKLSLPAQASGDSGIARFAIESAVDSNDFTISQYEDGSGTYTLIGQNLALNSGGNDAILDSGHRTAGIRLDGRGSGSIQFLTGNTNANAEAMRITKEGNVGIGTTSPSTTYNKQLHIHATGTGASLKLTDNGSGTASSDGAEVIMYNTNMYVTNREAANMYLQTSANTRVTIDSSGKVGIGDATPSHTLVVKGAAGTSPAIELINSDTEDGDTGRESTIRFSGYRSGGEAMINGQITGTHSGSSDDDKGMMTFFTNTGSGITEKMRIWDTGNVVVGSDTISFTDETKVMLFPGGGQGNVYNMSSTNEWWIMNNLASNSGYTTKIDFRTQNTSRGYIGITGSTVQFYGNSDYRLKENYKYDFDATSLIKAMKPLQFTWKDEPMRGTQTGFLAHELKEVCPYVVEGEKDAMREDDENIIRPQVVDQGKLVAVLTKALQEAIARIEALEAK